MDILKHSPKFAAFHSECKKAGLTAKHCHAEHWQVRGGKLLVNVYPEAKGGITIYVAGTRKGRKVSHLNEAITAAGNPPPIQPRKQRRKNTTYEKIKLLRKDPHCKWCGKELTFDTATIDHIVPRHRGGLDHINNYALACKPCNTKRGHQMPELSTHA